jgi:hypothetical protein
VLPYDTGSSFFTSVAHATECNVIFCYSLRERLHRLGRLGAAPFLLLLFHFLNHLWLPHAVRAFDQLRWNGALEAIATGTLVVVSFSDTSSLRGSFDHRLIFRFFLVIGVVVAWLDERPRAKTRTSRFAALAPVCIMA